MNFSRRSSIAALLALAGVPAFSQSARPLQVVASFSILADIVREVGGDAVEVAALVGPDADAHVFQPSPMDARRLASADLVVVNGLGFEGWIDRLVRASGYRGTVVVASKGVKARKDVHGHGGEQGHGSDPHAWQDLANAEIYVANVRDALSSARPAQAQAFAQRAVRYSGQIRALDRDVRAQFAVVPREKRRVITSHDAFEYFGAAYGIDFLSPQGISTDSEASAAGVARLVDQIRRQDARAVFVENISDPRLVERIAKEGGAVLGGKLYSDALSAPGTEADSYLKLFAHNAKALADGLAGTR
ncbi:MAG TPA: zinc ABC transporter substrate-binding protein [Burkholderiaceae bacterium]